MANFAITARKAATYDAIVIGSGISGGWAAKELTGKGLRTLVLERGRDVKHGIDYPTANLHPWEFAHRGDVPLDVREQNPIASRKKGLFNEATMHFVIRDAEQPFVAEKPFDWTRGYQVGGKSLLWARQTQRWSDFDFEGPARDGYAVDWPLRYRDLAPWYSYVETFAGISGNRDGLPQLPDGNSCRPPNSTAWKRTSRRCLPKHFPDRPLIQGRCAHITDPQPVHLQQGRTKCMHRTLCARGCPLGGYFSSNASTLPWAAKTGK
jgi:choline dehydrogenase-like flavoprotein